MSMSGHSGMILSLALVAVAIRLAQKGKIQRAWSAIFTGGGNSGTSSAGNAGGGKSGGGKAGSNDTTNKPFNSSLVPSPGIFGVPNIGFSGYGESYNAPVVANADQAGLSLYGGGTLGHDFDYGSGAKGGENLVLPGKNLGATYTYLGNYPGAWGNLEYYKVDLPGWSGVFGMPHVENVPNFYVGEKLQGGSFIGKIGKGPYNRQYWTAPHLAVIADRQAAAFFDWVSNNG